MDFISLEDAIWRVAPYVNGAPSALMLAQLRDAACDFCARTLIWRTTLTPVLTVVDQTAYTLPLPANSSLVKLISYSSDGSDQRQIVDAAEGEFRLSNNDYTECVWTDDRQIFRVSPPPKTAGLPMVLTVALKPSDNTVLVPEFIMDQHAATISAGAIARISAIPRQAFTDLQQAGIHEGVFTLRTKRVALSMARGFGRNARRTNVVWY